MCQYYNISYFTLLFYSQLLEKQMNKILLIMILILAISCDDKENEDFNEDMDEEIFQVEMIRENFVGDWSFQKWESIWNGDYI